MSWWFLISGISAFAVIWVVVSLYVRVRAQMKRSRLSEPVAPDQERTEPDLHS
jgi:hypothetical protein